MEDKELIEKVNELIDEEHASKKNNKKKTLAIIWISILAGVISILSLFSEQNNDSKMETLIGINDTYGYYQAKSIKQTTYKVAKDIMTVFQDNSSSAKQYQDEINHYNDEKTKLEQHAKSLEKRYEHLEEKNKLFHYAQSLISLSMILAGVGVSIEVWKLVYGSMAFGFLGGIMGIIAMIL